MRFFLYEHFCAANTISSLRVEGWAMLTALVEDFQALPASEVWTLLDHQCPRPLGQCHRSQPMAVEETFRKLASQADATLVIAPETDGVLARLNRLVMEVKGQLLGCAPHAVELTADKKMLAEHWQRHAVPTPELVDAPDFPGFAVVLKPRDGAGSQATFLIRDRGQWVTFRQQARHELAGDFVVQRFVQGQPASVAFLIGGGRIVPLVPAAQHLSDDGRFHYLGGHMPLELPLARRAVALAAKAVECVPGLAGYVGVDLVLGNAADGREDVAIEINPRLTTSYLGLRRLARSNLAQAMWQVFRGESIAQLSWIPGIIHFRADGTFF